jgi:hypothetical protein
LSEFLSPRDLKSYVAYPGFEDELVARLERGDLLVFLVRPTGEIRFAFYGANS